MKRYSVLLLYPDWYADYTGETFYDLSAGFSPQHAVTIARIDCLLHNVGSLANKVDEGPFPFDLEDLTPILVTEGHNFGRYVD